MNALRWYLLDWVGRLILVSDFINLDLGKWRIDLVGQTFVPFEAESILGIPFEF